MRAGARIESLWAIGGGARSLLWLRILASALDRSLLVGRRRRAGPGVRRGAARAARRNRRGTGRRLHAARRASAKWAPTPHCARSIREQREIFRGLYAALRESFAAARTTLRCPTQDEHEVSAHG